MDNEKYTVSLIDSIEDYIVKLQYLGRNKRTTLRALNTYKIFHWLYSWADWYEISEENKLKIEELMNCIILRNSAIILPVIEPESFYANVSSPQNIWTWRIITESSSTNPTTGTKILTIQSSNPSSNITMIVDKTDVNGDKNGVTEFTREYNANEIVKVSPPSLLPLGNIFNYWTLDGVAVTSDQLDISVEMDTDHTIVGIYRNAEPPVGSITITKEVIDENEDPISDSTEFTIILTKGNYILSRTVKKGYPIVFSSLELGIYTVTESSELGYTIESDNPIEIEITEQDLNQQIIIINKKLNTSPTTGTIRVDKNLNVEMTDGIFTYKLTHLGTGVIQYRAGTIYEPSYFYDVPFGDYTLEELPDSNYRLEDISPHNLNNVLGEFTIDGGNLTQVVIVTNVIDT